jgi:mono/diheme cytochrome c family protein
MMTSPRSQLVFAFSASALVAALIPAVVSATEPQTSPAAAHKPNVEHGAYLVRTMGCNDCHTPWKMGPKGPEMDMSRALTGHPQDLKMPPAPPLPAGPWIGVMSATNTAWAGPWGVSFTANLTPDKETGLGDWTEEMFIKTMRTGLHQGKGRPILPPMPFFMVGALNDSDIKDLFAYLQSLPPVHNRVPAPIDPTEGK